MHAIIIEKEQQISQATAGHTLTGRVRDERLEMHAVRELRNEVQRLKNRNKELETALREILNANQNAQEDEEDEEDEEDNEDDSTAVGSTFKRDDSQSLPMSIGFDDHSSGTSGHLSSGTLAGRVSGKRGHVDSLHTYTRLSTSTSPDATGGIELMSNPPVCVTVLPVVESASDANHRFADLSELNSAMQSIIYDTLNTMSSQNKFAGFSDKGSRRCGHSLLIDTHSVWTIEQPRCFACKRCFNKRRPCLHPLGKHRWALLPLPLGVRDSNATWQDEAYYVYAGEHASSTFSGVWNRH